MKAQLENQEEDRDFFQDQLFNAKKVNKALLMEVDRYKQTLMEVQGSDVPFSLIASAEPLAITESRKEPDNSNKDDDEMFEVDEDDLPIGRKEKSKGTPKEKKEDENKNKELKLKINYQGNMVNYIVPNVDVYTFEDLVFELKDFFEYNHKTIIIKDD